ncbi:MAG: hypothetical protein WAO00_16285 [Chthoniobacterales bacterium]
MTNSRMTNDEGMMKPEARGIREFVIRHSSFVIPGEAGPFVIRHSAF